MLSTMLFLVAAQQHQFPKVKVPAPTRNNWHPQVRHERGEPAWSHSKLTQTHPEFKKVRETVFKEFGILPENEPIPETRAMSAFADYGRSKKPVDAFRTLCLWAGTHRGVGPIKFYSLWDVLPKDDYEVARLHFLWGADDAANALCPLGDRLLAVNSKDAEVLGAMAVLRAAIWPDHDFAKATNYAAELMRLTPCRMSYFRYGQVFAEKFKASKDQKDAQVARSYLEKYLNDFPHTPKSLMVRMANDYLAELKKRG